MIAAEPLTADELAALDPGIRDTVAWLRGHGFDTTDSGDGRSKFVDAPDPALVDVDATLAIMRDEHAPAEGRIAAADALIARAFPGTALVSADWGGCAIPRPNVAISVAPADLVAECDRLRALIESTGALAAPLGPEDSEAIEIQGSYDPGDGGALILLLGFALGRAVA